MSTIQTPEYKFLKGLISVIMPCYNAEKYLDESINCVLKQTYSNVELIIIDDGSTDSSIKILESWQDKIKTIYQTNQGPGPARNRGIEMASGEYIAFLDSDDYWELDCLEVLHKALTDSDNAALSYCGWQNVGAAPNRCFPYIPPDYELEDKAERFLRSAAPWPIHGALIRHEILKEVGGFDEQWATCMDYDLWLRIGIKWPIVRAEKVLAYYRHHSTGQITSKQWRQAKNVLLVKENFIRNHASLVKHIPKQRLKELVVNAYINRGYDSYWKRDLVSAHKIFRTALLKGYFKLKDLKYFIPSLLPENLFIKLVASMEDTTKERI